MGERLLPFMFIYYFLSPILITMKKFKTSEEWINFFNEFTLFGKASQMSNYWYNKLDKAWELKWNYKKKNEIMWDMFSDWEDVIRRIDCDLHRLTYHVDLQTEEERVEYLNDMLVEYEWYLQW